MTNYPLEWGYHTDPKSDDFGASASKTALPTVAPDPGNENPGFFEVLRDPRFGVVPQRRGYPADRNALINNSPMVTEFSRRYDPMSPTFHHYQFSDYLCDLGGPGCSVDRAYQALQRHAVPGRGPLPVPFRQGAPSEVKLSGVSGGHILTYAEPSSRSIVNLTADDHVFRHGIVQRQIVVDGNKLYLRTFGIGNNQNMDLAQKNLLLARPAFETSTARIRAALLPSPPFTMRRDGSADR